MAGFVELENALNNLQKLMEKEKSYKNKYLLEKAIDSIKEYIELNKEKI